jgi:exopolysaccharide production protein ExoZ
MKLTKLYSKTYLTNISCLRAVAAVCVLLFHAIATSRAYGFPTNYLGLFEGWGFAGVDLFFIISGFVIYLNNSIKNFSFKEHLSRRFIRIAPIYWLLTTFLIVTIFAFPSFGKNFDLSVLSIISSYFFSSHIFLNHHPLLHIGWTIELEMYFYLLFSFSLLTKDYINPFLTTSLMLIFSVFVLKMDPILLEFIFGMFLSVIYINIKINKSTVNLIFILVIIYLIFILLFIDLHNLSSNRVLYLGVPFFGFTMLAVFKKQLKKGLFFFLGEASYSIYLIQFFTIPAFYKFIYHAKLINISGDFLVTFACVLTVALGYILYRFFEVPLGKKLK